MNASVRVGDHLARQNSANKMAAHMRHNHHGHELAVHITHHRGSVFRSSAKNGRVIVFYEKEGSVGGRCRSYTKRNARCGH
ncbi:hypothetical protein CPB85DRAFT_1330716 [Mucidula mucida]|nr:hypothetical protein CPB85DRAFT_1330716 [Mucidula mucida]